MSDSPKKIKKQLFRTHNRNMDFFEKTFPDIYKKIISLNQEQHYSLTIEEFNNNNRNTLLPNIEILNNKSHLYITNPLLEAELKAQRSLKNDIWIQFENKDLSHLCNIDKAIFISNGLGYGLNAYDKRYDIKSMLIIEDDIEVFKLSTFVVDYKKLSQNKHILFCINETSESIKNNLALFYYDLFFYNGSFKLVNDLNYIDTIYIIKLLKSFNPIENKLDYISLIKNNKFTISSQSDFNLKYNEIEKGVKEHNINGEFIPFSIGLLSYSNDILMNKSMQNETINNLYYFLLKLSVVTQFNFEEITQNCLNYFIYLDKLKKMQKEFYNNIISVFIQKNIDVCIYFQEKYIEFLKRTDVSSVLIEHQLYKLKAFKGENVQKSPENFIKLEFDNFANGFEHKLLNELNYTTPKDLAEEIKNFIEQEKKYDILDLGCGTGLTGLELKNEIKTLIGIDLSSKMLDIAKEKNIYTELINSDIDNYFQHHVQKKFDIITSTDVFIYIGELDNIFKSVVNHLNSNGVFGFSIELNQNDNIDYELNTTGRFSQSKAYIEKLANGYGFSILQYKEVSLRKNYNKDVLGALFLLTPRK